MNSLLTGPQRDRLTVVLVSPRNPLNIGAAARAMANFGFSSLSVVAPYEPHWREAQSDPHWGEAQSDPHWREANSAVGASDLLQNARITKTLADAVADCTLVVGTGSLEHRKPEQPVIPLPDLAPKVRDELARGGRIALVFGSEKRGLTQFDLSHCHLLSVIPTNPQQPSMNLGQAVAVCLYEVSARLALPAGELGAPGAGSPRTDLSSRGGDPSPLRTREAEPNAASPASTRDLELLAGLIDETMLATNYSPAAMRDANRHDLNLLLRRLTLTRTDAGRILGFFRRILWRLRNDSHRA
jgi:TrmH family RNA methyltransferase